MAPKPGFNHLLGLPISPITLQSLSGGGAGYSQLELQHFTLYPARGRGSVRTSETLLLILAARVYRTLTELLC